MESRRWSWDDGVGTVKVCECVNDEKGLLHKVRTRHI